jgi:2-polyprenyl-6-methoxyphenol hydroxylase-like FAD-dependent oxidoreductase
VRRLNVLISGAGIAGCTLAYWLARYGHAATVVERGSAIRSSGAPVDVRGPASQVVEEMGIGRRLQDASTRVVGLSLLDRSGRRRARIDLVGFRRSMTMRHVELPRGDLSAILHEASQDTAEFIFGDSIASLAEDDRAVEVTFERFGRRSFDLVIGADGLHSVVRRLAFGPETRFVHHAGLYVATLPLPRALDPQDEILMLNAPGRCVALHPSRDTPVAAFIFWKPEIVDLDDHDANQHKRIVEEAFGDLGWRVPEILAAVRASTALYFDAVSQVVMTDWARGRTALVGDAASCVSLFGDGSTLAIAGAHALALALAESPDDHAEAFRRYQSRHGKLVAGRQRNVTRVASMLVPRTERGVAWRNRIVGIIGAVQAGIKRLRRSPRLRT